jgi:predicted ArsR family transcriptional regulator
MRMETIRTQIMEYLKNRQQASTAELSHSLMVTRADIRYHLNLLEQNGVVEKHISAEVPSKGRPTYIYTLANRALPENYLGLARALLEINVQANSHMNSLDLLANVLIKPAAPSKRGNLLGDLTHKLNQSGYQARWEASSHGPRIIFRNCPYISLVKDFPILCLMDKRMIEIVVNTPFSQTAKSARAGGIGNQCVFKASFSP